MHSEILVGETEGPWVWVDDSWIIIPVVLSFLKTFFHGFPMFPLGSWFINVVNKIYILIGQ